MSQPVWVTPAQNLGTFPSGTPLNLQFIANSSVPGANLLTYKLLNGSLPEGIPGSNIVLSETGFLSGIPKNILVETTYSFTIRVTDDFGNFRDRTFSLNIFGFDGIKISTPPGNLLIVEDSTYIDYQINVNNPAPNNTYTLTISSGSLPPGLQMSSVGKITGFPLPPTNINGSPETKTYTFTVQLTSELGLDSKTYSIIIRNQQLSNPPNTRKPAILNNTPLVQPVSELDPYYRYYLPEDNFLSVINAGEYFSFKIIGYDFDQQPINYNFGVLPPGLLGDASTGWIAGVPVLSENSITEFIFSVQVSKSNDPTIVSDIETYRLIITNNINKDVIWETNSDLGIVNNGSTSNLYVKANSENALEYRLVAGQLPPNISLLDNGQLVGRFPFQPSSSLKNLNDISTYSFTVEAFNPQYPMINSERTFTLTILQQFETPVDNIYLKACPNIAGKKIIQSLLDNNELIPEEYLYRPNDPYYGKAKDVKYVHIYGVEPVNIEKYIDVISRNHYNRKLVLGEIKTAVAKDENNNIVYEVVYSEIIDDLVNKNGVSIPKEIVWPKKITLDEGPYFVANEDYFTSFENVYTSYTPGSVRTLYPASLSNMRAEVLETLPHNTNQSLLPKWMTSQQSNGETLGFIQAWVICYTLPGYSEVIRNNINNNWNYKLNIIDFSIDRLIVDKSATYNYNTNLLQPSWEQLPAAVPTPDPIDRYDLPILFPRETILPKNIDY